MSGYRSSARQGKAAMAGTKDTLARHRNLLVKSREIAVSHGLPILPILRAELIKVGIDPDTGERIDDNG